MQISFCVFPFTISDVKTNTIFEVKTNLSHIFFSSKMFCRRGFWLSGLPLCVCGFWLFFLALFFDQKTPTLSLRRKVTQGRGVMMLEIASRAHQSWVSNGATHSNDDHGVHLHRADVL